MRTLITFTRVHSHDLVASRTFHLQLLLHWGLGFSIQILEDTTSDHNTILLHSLRDSCPPDPVSALFQGVQPENVIASNGPGKQTASTGPWSWVTHQPAVVTVSGALIKPSSSSRALLSFPCGESRQEIARGEQACVQCRWFLEAQEKRATKGQWTHLMSLNITDSLKRESDSLRAIKSQLQQKASCVM